MISLKIKKYILIFSLFFFLFVFNKAEAATLYIKPSQTEVSAGNIVNIQLLFLNQIQKKIERTFKHL